MIQIFNQIVINGTLSIKSSLYFCYDLTLMVNGVTGMLTMKWPFKQIKLEIIYTYFTYFSGRENFQLLIKVIKEFLVQKYLGTILRNLDTFFIWAIKTPIYLRYFNGNFTLWVPMMAESFDRIVCIKIEISKKLLFYTSFHCRKTTCIYLQSFFISTIK